MAKYIVDTISMFKLSYLVEAESADDARDIVTCNENGEEVHQEHIDEIIVGTKKIKSDKQYNKFVNKASNGQFAEELTLTKDTMIYI